MCHARYNLATEMKKSPTKFEVSCATIVDVLSNYEHVLASSFPIYINNIVHAFRVVDFVVSQICEVQCWLVYHLIRVCVVHTNVVLLDLCPAFSNKRLNICKHWVRVSVSEISPCLFRSGECYIAKLMLTLYNWCFNFSVLLSYNYFTLPLYCV